MIGPGARIGGGGEAADLPDAIQGHRLDASSAGRSSQSCVGPRGEGCEMIGPESDVSHLARSMA